MWRSSKRFLMVGSVALNCAFVGVWFVHAIPASVGKEPSASPPAKPVRIWCPLHDKLNVSDQQWAQIEPRLKAFRQSAQSICEHMSQLRLEILDLIAAPAPDREAIAAKQEEIRTGQATMQQLVIEHLLAEKEILTPEQKERFFTMIREQSSCDRHGPMMMPGRGGVGRLFRDNPTAQ